MVDQKKQHNTSILAKWQRFNTIDGTQPEKKKPSLVLPNRAAQIRKAFAEKGRQVSCIATKLNDWKAARPERIKKTAGRYLDVLGNAMRQRVRDQDKLNF